MENRRGRIGTIKDRLVALSPLSRGERDSSEGIISTNTETIVFNAQSHAHEHRMNRDLPTIHTETPLFKGPKLF